MSYLFAETNVHSHVIRENWKPAAATTRSHAQSEALRAQMFKGTELHVGYERNDGSIVHIASRKPGNAGRWVETDFGDDFEPGTFD